MSATGEGQQKHPLRKNTGRRGRGSRSTESNRTGKTKQQAKNINHDTISKRLTSKHENV